MAERIDRQQSKSRLTLALLISPGVTAAAVGGLVWTTSDLSYRPLLGVSAVFSFAAQRGTRLPERAALALFGVLFAVAFFAIGAFVLFVLRYRD
jgi:hypothetical protein